MPVRTMPLSIDIPAQGKAVAAAVALTDALVPDKAVLSKNGSMSQAKTAVSIISRHAKAPLKSK